METISKEYKEKLESLKPIDSNKFIEQIKTFKDNKEISYFKTIEEYIKEFMPIELLNIILKEEFIKLFYLDSQAKYIKENLNLNQDLDIIKTMVYCYNDFKREFEKNIKEEKLKKELLEKGFKEFDFLKREYKEENKEEYKKRCLEYYKPLSNLKVICVFDKDKIGLLGSYTNKEEHTGKLFFDEIQNRLFFMPKRHTRTGQILRSKFYYKEI